MTVNKKVVCILKLLTAFSTYVLPESMSQIKCMENKNKNKNKNKNFDTHAQKPIAYAYY
jgi:hypothetical protein